MSANLLHICECLCVRLSVTYRRLNHWTDFHKIWNVSRVWPGDKHGLKISENSYHGNENSRLWYLAKKTLGATDVKLGMHIQLHSGSNMCWVPFGYTCSIPYVGGKKC